MRNLCTALIIVLMAGLWQCQKDYVTGRSTLSLMSESQEVALGRDSHESVLAQFGSYEHAQLQQLLDDRGAQIASVSHRSNLEYHFYVVDSPVVNAFALPGGYVYFTRGILAHFNTEAELVGVLGHEVGHVVARHGAEQYSRTMLTQVGLGLATVFSEDFREYAMFAELGASLILLKFSRNQESESDRLGVRYAATLGYDAHRMADFFETVGRLSDAGGQRVPNFLSTHPNPDNRRDTIHALADELAKEGLTPTRQATRNDYLAMINGMTYGEDPKYGYLENGVLYVPQWRLFFKPESSAQTQFQRNAVQFAVGEGKAWVMFRQDNEHSEVDDSMAAFAQQAKLDSNQSKAATFGPFQGLELIGSLEQQGGQLNIHSFFFKHQANVFQAFGVTEQADSASMEPVINRLLSSAAPLNDHSALNRQAAKLRIVKAPKQDTLRANLTALHVAQDDLEDHAILNAADLNDRITKNHPLKVVRY